MSGFLLDTNACIRAIDGHEAVVARLGAEPQWTLHVSVIVECELAVMAVKSNAPAKARRRVEAFLERVRVLAFTSDDAVEYAHVRARLERAGTPIGPLDTLIGSHALARGLVLVTENTREFSRIRGLSIEDWTR